LHFSVFLLVAGQLLALTLPLDSRSLRDLLCAFDLVSVPPFRFKGGAGVD